MLPEGTVRDACRIPIIKRILGKSFADCPIAHAARHAEMTFGSPPRPFDAAFLAAVPPHSPLVWRAAFSEARGKGSVDAKEVGGFRLWHDLFTHKLVDRTVAWLGATIQRDRAGPDAANKASIDVDSLEGAFREGVAEAQARLHLVDTATNDESLELELLALQYSLTVAVFFVEMFMARPAVARALLETLAVLWRASRVPGEPGRPFQKQLLADFLLDQLRINLFWTFVSFQLTHAAQSRKPPLVDVVAEFPLAAAPLYRAELVSLPAPSTFAPDEPTPPNLLAFVVPLTCEEYLGWLSPDVRLADKAGVADRLLKLTLGAIPGSGIMAMPLLLRAVDVQIRSLSRTIASEGDGELSMLDVLVAEELVEREFAQYGRSFSDLLGNGEGDGDDLASLLDPSESLASGMPSDLFATVVRKRLFLVDVLDKITAALPPGLLEAFNEGDPATMKQRLGYDAAVPIVMGLLVYLQQLKLVVSAPEPFVDLFDPASLGTTKAGENADNHLQQTTPMEPMIHIWFRSSSFEAAAEIARGISQNIRSFLKAFPPAKVKVGVTLLFYCAAATHAAWMHLLILQRVVTKHGPHSTKECVTALADVEVCLEMLRAASRPHFTGIADILQGFLDGERSRLSQVELRSLRMARKLDVVCRHRQNNNDSTTPSEDGICYACLASDGAEEDEPDFATLADLSLESPMSPNSGGWGSFMSRSMPLSGSILRRRSGRLRKSVGFKEDVDIWETWSEEDYPARSARAPDFVEADNQHDDRVTTAKPEQVDLRQFWTKSGEEE